MTKKSRLRDISLPAVRMLQFGLFLVLAQAAGLCHLVYKTFLQNPRYVVLYYPPALERVMLSLGIVILGAALLNAICQTRTK